MHLEVNHRPIRDISVKTNRAPQRWGWTYRKLLALHDTVEALQGAVEELPRPVMASELIDRLRAAGRHGATLYLDGTAVHVQAADLSVSIVLPKWARELLRTLAGEVTL